DRGPRPGERSIIVQGSGAATIDPAIELATDQSVEPLEPIADASEYEAESQPELADPPVAAEPDLAEPPADGSESIATDEPLIDEFPAEPSIEEFAEATDELVTRPAAPPGMQTASFN